MKKLSTPGAIPTVDFLLHHLTAVVKKVVVKTHDFVGCAKPT